MFFRHFAFGLTQLDVDKNNSLSPSTKPPPKVLCHRSHVHIISSSRKLGITLDPPTLLQRIIPRVVYPGS